MRINPIIVSAPFLRDSLKINSREEAITVNKHGHKNHK
jgi:hypothetical protein